MTQTTDHFQDKAKEWDTRPIPMQISQSVYDAMDGAVHFSPEQSVMDFGAGTGLVCAKIAPHVGTIHAVDVSRAMLEQLAAKPELQGKVTIHCQDILTEPLEEQVDLIVSAMAMHHVEDTAALLRAWHAHLKPGGRIAIADLDSEEGDFHPAEVEGVFHHGFERAALANLVEAAGFSTPEFVTAVSVDREDRGKSYPVFLMSATRR